MKLRLFVGISAPPEWKRAIVAWRRANESRFSDSFGRWTSETNLHLTLRFFGSIDEREVIAIAGKIQSVAAGVEPFTVAPGLLGCFPNPSRPRILWIGFEGANENLVTLESRLRGATVRFGQAPEERPFHPHLTLARLKAPTRRDRDEITEIIGQGAPIGAIPWRIDRVELIRSLPQPGGSIYTELAALPLGPRAAGA
jgi:2'-5' RNA ligase